MLTAVDGDRAAEDVERLTAICADLPEVEVTSEGRHTSFAVRGKRFAWHLIDHHGDGRVDLQCKAAPGANDAMVARDPARFHLPPYMARHGWVGLRLDAGEVDWDEVAALVTEAYVLMAPRRLAAMVDPPPDR
jgi:hypothetical protein